MGTATHSLRSESARPWDPPKEPRRNLLWRRRVLKPVLDQPRLQKGLFQRCSEDILLFINLAGWLYEPRLVQQSRIIGRKVPFITYEYQDGAILRMQGAVEQQHDLLIEKSRDMGATWMCLYVFLWYWLFQELTSFMLVSRNKDLVWKKGDPDALFTKLEFAVGHLPPWLQPINKETELHLENQTNGSVIDGEASTGNVGRGGRRTAVLMDEFAAFDAQYPGSGERALNATADNSNCRIFNSTPQGQANAFYRLRTQTKIKILTLHWTEHPVKGADVYYDLEGKARSPWYDAQLERRGSQKAMAQEVDIDYAAAGGLFFDRETLDEVQAQQVRPPYQKGEILYDVDSDGHVENVRWAEGYGNCRFKLWMHLDNDGKPRQDHNYVVSADISDGTGASNSVIDVGDTSTREKVAEFACPNTPPEELGRLFVAVCRFFAGQLGSAFGIWEANGSGAITGQEITKKQEYTYVYYRAREEEDHPRRSDKAGWVSTLVNKTILFGNYRAGLKRREIMIRSAESIDEARRYVKDERGMPVAGTIADLGTGARAQHGDRVVADALLLFGFGEQPKAPIPELQAPRGSFEWRKRHFASQEKERKW